MYAQLTRRAVPLNQQSRVSLQQMREQCHGDSRHRQTPNEQSPAEPGASPTGEHPTNSLLVLPGGALPTPTINSSCQITEFSDEFRIFTPGQNNLVIDIDGYRAGFAICEDIWQDNGPASQLRMLALMLITINGSPFEENTKITHAMTCVFSVLARCMHRLMHVNQVGGQR